jgi:putative spermidine/putrescine transport system substrate-binding protein
VPRIGTTWRRVLASAASAAGVAVGSGAITGFPFVFAEEPVTLRIAGTGVNQFKELADKAKAELGFTIQYTSLVSDEWSSARLRSRARSICSIPNIGC